MLEFLTSGKKYAVKEVHAHAGMQNFHGNFDAWRWLLMVGLLVPIHHTGNLAVRCMVWAVESIFFFQKKALYYLVGTKVCITHEWMPC